MASTTAASVSLSAPYPLLALAASKNGTQVCYGSTVTADNRQSSKKRKSTEAVVAVDGEGIYILDVHSAKSISAYALPPSTKFSCDPISVRSSTATRRTYASTSGSNAQILCWEEYSTRKSASRSTSTISSPSSEYSTLDHNVEKHARPVSNDKKVTLLHILNRKRSALSASAAAHADTESDVLALYEDGSFECLSSDLETLRWSSSSKKASAESKVSSISLATMISLKVAKSTILKKRSDILFGHETSPGDVALLTISKLPDNESPASLDLYVISNSSLVGNVRLLLSVPLSSKDTAHWDTSQLSYHALSGTLFQLNNGSLVTYDLSASLPQPLSALSLQQQQTSEHQGTFHSSILRISSSNVLVTSPSSVSLYNTKYGALHARVNIGSFDDPALVKEHKTDGEQPIRFLTYLQGARVAVGYSAESVIALQITTAHNFTGQSLMDSICKGVERKDSAPSYSVHSAPPQPSSRKSVGENVNQEDRVLQALALSTLEKLRRSAAEQNVRRFEEIFAEYVGLEINLEGLAAQKEVWLEDGGQGQSGGGGEFDELPEFLIKEDAPRAISQPFAASVLAMIFQKDSRIEDGQGIGKNRLHLITFAPNVLKFLLSEGYFACSNLPDAGNGIISALYDFDPDLNVLLFFLENADAAAFPLNEVVKTIQLVLENLVRPADGGEIFDDSSSESAEGGEGDGEADDAMLQKAAASAERAIERAQRLLNLNNTKESVLRAALIRANRYPQRAVVRAFREGLGGNELAGLIRILRRELLRDGEERTDSDVEDSLDEDGWLELICDLLANCLDAAGVTGLLLAKDAVVKTPPMGSKAEVASDALVLGAAEGLVEREELLLESLCSEVSDACEELEGESTLSLLFSDLLNQAEAFRLAGLAHKKQQQQQASASKSARRKGARKGRSKGTRREDRRINGAENGRQQLQSWQSNTGGVGRAKNPLPLGYPVPLLDKASAKSPSELKRRRRIEERQKSMAIGDYTLEQIDI